MDKFRPTLISTVGVNFKNKRTLIEGESVIVQVWDTAGQPEFHTITKSYYKGANGIMLLYDVSDHKSFSNIDYWIKCIKENAQENVNIVLVGNKSDLRIRNEENYISFEAGHNIASKYNVPFIETSAKDSKNVDNAFLYLAKTTLGLDISPSSHAAARNSLLSKLRSKSDEPSASTSPGNTHITRSNSGGSTSRSISSISSGSENNNSSSSSSSSSSNNSSNCSSNSKSGNNDSSGDTSISDSANKNPEKCTIS
jgi:small GTP-binding protein